MSKKNKNKNTKVYTPHDLFFKNMLQDNLLAQKFLQCFLPEKFLKHMDLSTVSVAKVEFVDHLLSKLAADVVLKARLKHFNCYFFCVK